MTVATAKALALPEAYCGVSPTRDAQFLYKSALPHRTPGLTAHSRRAPSATMGNEDKGPKKDFVPAKGFTSAGECCVLWRTPQPHPLQWRLDRLVLSVSPGGEPRSWKGGIEGRATRTRARAPPTSNAIQRACAPACLSLPTSNHHHHPPQRPTACSSSGAAMSSRRSPRPSGSSSSRWCVSLPPRPSSPSPPTAPLPPRPRPRARCARRARDDVPALSLCDQPMPCPLCPAPAL